MKREKCKVITLCGSTRFEKEFNVWNQILTLNGYVVFSLGMFGKSPGDVGKDKLEAITYEGKRILEKVQLTKIDMSDAIFVVDSNGYIGKSTRKEIEYAKEKGKIIVYGSACSASHTWG